MERRFYIGLVTPPIHFGRVILDVWSGPFLVSLLRPFSGSFIWDVCLGRYLCLLRFLQCFVVNTIRSIHHLSGEGALTKLRVIYLPNRPLTRNVDGIRERPL